MKSLRVLYHMMRADFLERTRRYSFLVMLLAIIYLGFAVSNGTILLRLGDYRGIYTSAWVGSLMALIIVTFLGWFGFYLIKNTIDRDERTGVGQIIATTPLSRVEYTLGKWLSNFLLLSTLCLILAVAAVMMQFLQREDPVFDLWALIEPFLFVALPFMALVSAVAVLFETIPWLRGGFGNIVYFFLFAIVMVACLEQGKKQPEIEPFGIRLLTRDMAGELLQIDPSHNIESFSLGTAEESETKIFRWNGMDWTPRLILLRMGWIGVSVGLAAAAALFFHRFDSSRFNLSFLQGRAKKLPKAGPEIDGEVESKAASKPRAKRSWQPGFLAGLVPRSGFAGLVASELRLMLKGQRWYWYAGALAILVGCLVSPLQLNREGWLLAAAIWPVLIWSQMGVRESRYNMESLVFSAPRPLMRLLAATWAAGVLLTGLLSVGAAVQFLAAGEMASFGAWLLFTLLVPSLALVLGVWSKTNKPFEVVYLLIWYLGPLKRIPTLDFLGGTPDAVVLRQPLLVHGLILLLLALAVLGRKQRLAI